MSPERDEREAYFDSPLVEEKIYKELAERKAKLEALTHQVKVYLTSTMFWFFETNDSCTKIPAKHLMARELNLMLMNDLVKANHLVPYDAMELRKSINQLLDKEAVLLERKKYQSRDGTTFFLHTLVVRLEGADDMKDYQHAVDKFCFTAGLGRPWVEYTAMQKDSVQDFIYDVMQGVGDLTQQSELKTSDTRMTCVFPLNGQRVQASQEQPS